MAEPAPLTVTWPVLLPEPADVCHPAADHRGAIQDLQRCRAEPADFQAS
jgi:hypothetical protein